MAAYCVYDLFCDYAYGGVLCMINIGSARIYDRETDKHVRRSDVYIYDREAQDVLFIKEYKYVRLDTEKYKVEMVW